MQTRCALLQCVDLGIYGCLLWLTFYCLLVERIGISHRPLLPSIVFEPTVWAGFTKREISVGGKCGSMNLRRRNLSDRGNENF